MNEATNDAPPTTRLNAFRQRRRKAALRAQRPPSPAGSATGVCIVLNTRRAHWGIGSRQKPATKQPTDGEAPAARLDASHNVAPRKATLSARSRALPGGSANGRLHRAQHKEGARGGNPVSPTFLIAD